MRLADSFTMCQTAFTVMPSPHVLPTLLTRRKSFPRSIAAAASQSSNSVLTQSGTGTVRTWPPNNGPMFFALLEMMQSQRHGFMPPQAAREQQCEQCSVAFSFQSLMIGGLPKCLALLRSQPIAEAHSQFPHPFDTANTSRQIGNAPRQ